MYHTAWDSLNVSPKADSLCTYLMAQSQLIENKGSINIYYESGTRGLEPYNV